MSSIGDGFPPIGNHLARVGVDGEVTIIPNTYEGIKAALDGATMDFSQISDTLGVYLDDEGVLNRLPLNVPVSLNAGAPVYGPVVLCAAKPDSEGNTLPPTAHDVEWFRRVGERWNRVVVGIMVRGSGDPYARGNPDDLAPPIVLLMDEHGNFIDDDN